MKNKLSFKIAFSGLMAALSVAILLMSGFVPILTYCAPLFACIFLVPVMEELNKKWAWMTWTAASLLSLILCADKEAAFFYMFIGYYPMLKPFLDRIWNKPLRMLAKLGVFSFAIVGMYALLYYVIRLDVVMQDMQSVSLIINIVYIAVMVLILMCFDFILRYISRFYRVRIKPKLKIR